MKRMRRKRGRKVKMGEDAKGVEEKIWEGREKAGV